MFWNNIFNYLGTLASTMDEARLAYKTYSELSQLSDADLAQLGLVRSDIPRVAFRIEEKTVN